MDIVEITLDNVLDYIDFVPVDAADNIGRIFVNGLLAIEDGKPGAGIIWELKNIMNDKPKESRIIWISVKDEDAMQLLFEKYKESISPDDVERSYYSIPASIVSKEKEALLANGFSAELSEGDEITASLWQVADMAVLKKIPEDKAVHNLMSISPGTYGEATKRMTKMGLTGLCEDLTYLPRSFFDNDVSVFIQQGDSIDGLFLLHRLPSGSLKLMLMAYIGNDYIKLLKMMKKSLQHAMEAYGIDTRIVIDRHNISALALGERMLPHEIGKPVFVGSRTE